MPTYDGEAFDPPAPVAYVRLQHPQNDKFAKNVPMLLDSGADVTLIPRSHCETLNLPSAAADNNAYVLVGFDGSQQQALAVEARMQFEGLTFRGRFLPCEGSTGIIGRNILNLFRVTLDGKKLSWSLDSSI